jgi:cytoskeletal protein CcmA (bactofilin family)
MTVPGVSSAATLIDASTTLDGTISTSGNLRIQGRVSGAITCSGVLEVVDGAEVDATIEAACVIVAGVLSGVITCRERLEIRETGVVRGKVETGRLIIVEGAVYEGQLRMEAALSHSAQTLDSPEPAVQPSTGSYSFLRNFAPGASTTPTTVEELPAPPEDDEPN